VDGVCGQYFGMRGETCDLNLHAQLMTIDPPSRRGMKCVIGVRQQKASAILGALQTGSVDILVKDDGATMGHSD
jgi:DNA-binding transcriptional regulator LsrR (DeoR family)